ncbi:hypothetical protein Cni_G19622 [Canna indica]|uniref:Uncharacterized protein n=1 Tax=Canna indica TaxID=4628 RepID=A0AAQ3KKU3_9LILI|nr:hypothetical protein Cni_G19622 [Canna indica]
MRVNFIYLRYLCLVSCGGLWRGKIWLASMQLAMEVEGEKGVSSCMEDIFSLINFSDHDTCLGDVNYATELMHFLLIRPTILVSLTNYYIYAFLSRGTKHIRICLISN